MDGVDRLATVALFNNMQTSAHSGMYSAMVNESLDIGGTMGLRLAAEVVMRMYNQVRRQHVAKYPDRATTFTLHSADNTAH